MSVHVLDFPAHVLLFSVKKRKPKIGERITSVTKISQLRREFERRYRGLGDLRGSGLSRQLPVINHVSFCITIIRQPHLILYTQQPLRESDTDEKDFPAKTISIHASSNSVFRCCVLFFARISCVFNTPLVSVQYYIIRVSNSWMYDIFEFLE